MVRRSETLAENTKENEDKSEEDTEMNVEEIHVPTVSEAVRAVSVRRNYATYSDNGEELLKIIEKLDDKLQQQKNKVFQNFF